MEVEGHGAILLLLHTHSLALPVLLLLPFLLVSFYLFFSVTFLLLSTFFSLLAAIS